MNFSGIRQYFETEHLIARKPDPGYAPALFEAASESVVDVYPYLPWCHPDYTQDESLEWLNFSNEQWQLGNAYGFCLFRREDDQFIGGCGINQIDEHPVANLGYWIRSSAIGQGFATQAARGLSQFAFEFLAYQRLEIIMSIKNLASQKVAINLAAEYDGLLKQRLFLHGESHDAHLYSLTRN